MKRHKALDPKNHIVPNPGVREAIKQFGMTIRKSQGLEEMSWWGSRKLKPGQKYITKKGKLAWRRTFKEEVGDFLLDLLSWILFPFIWVGRRIGRAFHNFFYMKTNFQNNGIIGPGYSSWHEEHFSWGKLSFILVVLFIITYFIFLR